MPNTLMFLVHKHALYFLSLEHHDFITTPFNASPDSITPTFNVSANAEKSLGIFTQASIPKPWFFYLNPFTPLCTLSLQFNNPPLNVSKVCRTLALSVSRFMHDTMHCSSMCVYVCKCVCVCVWVRRCVFYLFPPIGLCYFPLVILSLLYWIWLLTQ